MEELTSYYIYHKWRMKHWNYRTMHTPTKIQKAVFKRIEGTKNRLIDIIDNPTGKDLEKTKAFYDNDSLSQYDYELVREAGKKVLLVWATFKQPIQRRRNRAP